MAIIPLQDLEKAKKTNTGKVIPTSDLQKAVKPALPTTAPEEKPWWEKGAEAIGGVTTGFGKEALKTVGGLASLGEKAVTGVTANLPYGKEINKALDVGQEKTVAERTITPEITTPKGTAEEVGSTLEQVGEFFVPAGALSKAGKAVSVIKNPLLRKATQIGTEAIGTGATQYAQSTLKGKTQEEAIKEGITTGILGGAIKGVSSGVSNIISKIPEKNWQTILKRTSTQVKKSPNLPAQAGKTGMVGTKEQIAKQSAEKIKDIELGIDDLLSGRPETIDMARVASYTDDLIKTYENIPGEESAVQAIKSIKEKLINKGSLTLEEANQLKKDIYKNISNSYGKGVLQIPAKTESQKQIARGLKEEIEKVIPDVKKENEKIAIYAGIKKAIDRQLSLGEGRGVAGTGLGLYDLGLGGVGTGFGVATGSPFLGLALVGGKKLAESPVVLSGMSKLANYFNSLSPTQKELFYQGLKGLTIYSQKSMSEK